MLSLRRPVLCPQRGDAEAIPRQILSQFQGQLYVTDNEDFECAVCLVSEPQLWQLQTPFQTPPRVLLLLLTGQAHQAHGASVRAPVLPDVRAGDARERLHFERPPVPEQRDAPPR